MIIIVFSHRMKMIPYLALAVALAVLFCQPVMVISAAESARWVSVPSGTKSDLYGLWGSSETDIFAVGSGGTVMHYDGNVWSLMATDNTTSLSAVWGSSGADVFAVGTSGKIKHYDGKTWSLMTSGITADLRTVWGRSGKDVFAAGDSGTIIHYDGNSWVSMSSTTSNSLYCLWGSSVSGVYVVGIGGTSLRYDGKAWVTMTSGTKNDLTGLWGSSDADVFVVGKAGSILHYDGKSWVSMKSGTAGDLNAVWGSSGTDVYAVGSAGTIQHYDGSTWSSMSRNVASDLNGVWGVSSSVIQAVGTGGIIARYAPPVITGLVPNQGSQGGTYDVTLTGRNFSGSTEVSLGAGIAVNGFTVNSPDKITASIAITAGAPVGTRNVSVTAPGGEALLTGGFTVKQALPVIASVSPSVANQEISLNVILSGANFSGATEVSFGPGILTNSFGVIQANQITASITITTGAATGTRDIYVTTPGGTASLPGGFTVKQVLPLISSVSPGQGSLGATLDVTLSGKNFNGASEVRFGAGVAINRYRVTNASTIEANITILAGSTTGTRDVSVTTPGGAYVLPNGFALKQGQPIIVSISPPQGNKGDTLDVIINGSNLEGATAVSFGSEVAVASVSSRSATQVAARIVLSMSAAAGTRDVSVITEGGTGTLAGGFTVNEGPLGALFIAMVWVGIAVALAALWWVLRILRRRRAASL